VVLGGGLRCAGCVLGAKLLTLVGRGLVGSGVLALTALLACCLCFFWGLALAHKDEAIDLHYLIACDWGEGTEGIVTANYKCWSNNVGGQTILLHQIAS